MLMGAAAIVLLYHGLRDSWTPLGLLGLLTVVWCCATPYAHANDALLFVPGGLAALAVLGSSARELGAAARSRFAPTSWRGLARAGAQLLGATLALVALWFGGVIGLLAINYLTIRPMVLAPLFLLATFALAAMSLVQASERPSAPPVEQPMSQQRVAPRV
jgi:hypothetical protein